MGLVRVCVCDVYKHLGSRICVDGSLNCETKSRAGACLKASKESSRVIKESTIHNGANHSAVRALCTSRLVLSARCGVFNPKLQEKLSSAYVIAHRRAFGCVGPQNNLTNSAFLAKTHTKLLRPFWKQKLKYFARFVHEGPSPLKTIVNAEYAASLRTSTSSGNDASFTILLVF